MPALQRGNVEMSTMNTFEVDQQIPELGAYSAGYGFRDWSHVVAVFRSQLGAEYVNAVRERMRIEIIAVTYLGTRQLNLRQFREVRQPSDLAGLRVRMPPGPGWVALGRGLGFVPTPMAIPEVYLALRNGTVDGQDNPVAITRANNFHEVTQQIVLTSHLVQPVFYAIAKPWWDRLSPRQQEVFRRHAAETAAWNDQQRLADEAAVLDFSVPMVCASPPRCCALPRLGGAPVRGRGPRGPLAARFGATAGRGIVKRLVRRVMEALAVLLFAAMLLLFVAQIVMRALGRPILWSDEVLVLLMIWCALLTAAFLIEDRDEVVFDLLHARFPEEVRRWIAFAGAVLAGVIFATATPE